MWLEVGVAVAGLDLRDQSERRGHALLVLVHVERRVVVLVVQAQVGERRGQQLGGSEALVEILAVAQLLHQLVGNHLAREVVRGVLTQHLGFESPVLHDLRGQLHEVALHVGQTAVAHLVEHEVERMAELVEEGLRLVERESSDGAVLVGSVKLRTMLSTGAHALAVLVALLGV